VTANVGGRLKPLVVLCCRCCRPLAGTAAAQFGADKAQFNSELAPSGAPLSDLSAKVEQLKASNHQIQQQLEKMRTHPVAALVTSTTSATSGNGAH
jgi:hypothetical protein